MNISVDLDGVLNFYPANWLDFLNIEHAYHFQDIQEAKCELSYKEYKDFKQLFRDSKYETEAPVRESLVAQLNSLTLLGNTLYVHTSRAVYGKNYFKKTYTWLESTGLNFADLGFKTDSNFSTNQISVHIDDDVNFLTEAAEYSVELKLFLFTSAGSNYFDPIDESSLLETMLGLSK